MWYYDSGKRCLNYYLRFILYSFLIDILTSQEHLGRD
nr:MAG TPA: hypothetical protein [Caudoviricetes sp.]